MTANLHACKQSFHPSTLVQTPTPRYEHPRLSERGRKAKGKFLPYSYIQYIEWVYTTPACNATPARETNPIPPGSRIQMMIPRSVFRTNEVFILLVNLTSMRSAVCGLLRNGERWGVFEIVSSVRWMDVLWAMLSWAVRAASWMHSFTLHLHAHLHLNFQCSS